MKAGERLLQTLDRFFALYQHGQDVKFNLRLQMLQGYQRDRLIDTHAKLINDPKTEPAARFLIDDVYGGRDLKPVAIDIRRAIGKAQKLLPNKVLETSATALEAAVLTQELDEGLTALLGDHLDGPLGHDLWCAAYREQQKTELRVLQLTLVGDIGPHLDRYVRSRMIQSTFKLVRKPAHAAGFGNLYDFLDMGFSAMKDIDRCDVLLQQLANTEQQIMQRILASHPQPFEVRSLDL